MSPRHNVAHEYLNVPRRPGGGARRLPARLPRYLRLAHHGGERCRGQGVGQPAARHDRRGAVRQGVQVHRTQLPPRTPAAPDEACGAQGQRAVRARGLGRGAQRHRHPAADHRQQKPGSHPALQLRGHHGPGAGRRHGGALFPPTGRLAAGAHHLRQRRGRSAHPYLRWQGGHEGAVFCRKPADPDLGQQFDWQQPAFLAPGPTGQTQRRAPGLHRPAQDRNRREMSRAHRPAAGHRCGPCPGADARADQPRLAGPRLHRPPHRGLGRLAHTGAGVAARTRR